MQHFDRSVEGLSVDQPMDKLLLHGISLACLRMFQTTYPNALEPYRCVGPAKNAPKLLVPLIIGNSKTKLRKIAMIVDAIAPAGKTQSAYIKDVCNFVQSVLKQLGTIISSKLASCVIADAAPPAGGKGGKDAKAGKGDASGAQAVQNESQAYVLPPNVLVRLPVALQWVRDALDKVGSSTLTTAISTHFDGDALADSITINNETGQQMLEFYAGEKMTLAEMAEMFKQVGSEFPDLKVVDHLMTMKSQSLLSPMLNNTISDVDVFVQDPRLTDKGSRTLNLRQSPFLSTAFENLKAAGLNELIILGIQGDADVSKAWKLAGLLNASYFRIGAPSRPEYFEAYRLLQL